jgi:glycosidase
MRTVLGGDVAGVRLATLLQTTLPGAPCVYYGDEVGLVGGNDPESRGAFPWDPSRWEPGVRESVGALLRLRASESALRDSPLRVAGTVGGAVAFERGAGSSRFVVAANAGEEPVDLALRFEGETSGHGRDLIPVQLPGFEQSADVPVVDGVATLRLGPRSGAVLRVV